MPERNTGALATGMTFYRPDEVAKLLRCSEWWIKEQARRGRIPFSWIGGSYLFTSEHIADIVSLFERRPLDPATVTGSRLQQPAARSRSTASQPEVRLRARTPRRTRSIQRQTDAA